MAKRTLQAQTENINHGKLNFQYVCCCESTLWLVGPWYISSFTTKTIWDKYRNNYSGCIIAANMRIANIKSFENFQFPIQFEMGFVGCVSNQSFAEMEMRRASMVTHQSSGVLISLTMASLHSEPNGRYNENSDAHTFWIFHYFLSLFYTCE